MKVPRRTFDRTHLWQTWHAGIQDSGLNIWGFLPSLVEKPYEPVWLFSFPKSDRHTFKADGTDASVLLACWIPRQVAYCLARADCAPLLGISITMRSFPGVPYQNLRGNYA